MTLRQTSSPLSSRESPECWSKPASTYPALTIAPAARPIMCSILSLTCQPCWNNSHSGSQPLRLVPVQPNLPVPRANCFWLAPWQADDFEVPEPHRQQIPAGMPVPIVRLMHGPHIAPHDHPANMHLG